MKNYRRLDQRIKVTHRAIIHESLERGHLRNNVSSVLQRNIDDGSCSVMIECVPWCHAEPVFGPLRSLKHVDENRSGDQAVVFWIRSQPSRKGPR